MNPARWMEWLPVLGLCMMRPLGVAALLPMLSSAVLGGALVRNAMVLLIALPLLPAHIGLPALAQAGDSWSYTLLLAGELLIGVSLGFAAALPFWAIDMAGYVIDTMRGSSMASALNPMLGAQSSLFGSLFSQVLGLLFLASGSFQHLLTGIYESYRILPPGAALGFGSAFLPLLYHDWQLMFELCIAFALPAIVVMVLVDVGLGLINRSAQQLNVFVLSMPVKSVLALLVVAVALPSMFRQAQLHIAQFGVQAQALLEALR